MSCALKTISAHLSTPPYDGWLRSTTYAEAPCIALFRDPTTESIAHVGFCARLSACRYCFFLQVPGSGRDQR